MVWLVALVLALVALAIYAPTFVVPHDFVAYDDNMYVLDEPNINGGLSLAGIRFAATRVVAGNWHPVTVLSHMLDCELYGLAPRGHHLTSVLLHAANGVLLFLVLLRMTSSLWPSAMVAALFAWHPLRVESVAWIAERKDVLSTFFMLLALACYVRYAARNSWLAYAVSLVAFVLGLMSKPMLVTFPFVLCLIDLWPLERLAQRAKSADDRGPAPSLGRLLAEKIPFAILSAIVVGTTLWAQSLHGAIYDLPLVARVANAVVSYYAYIAMTFYPYPLYVPYLFVERQVPLAISMIAAIALVAATVAAALAVRRRPYITVGWLWYLGTLLPVIGLVQVGGQSMADRYTYVPAIGIYLIVAWSLAELAARGVVWRRALVGLSTVALLSIVALSCIQVTYWRDTRTLFAHTLRYSPHSHAARVALATQAVYDGDHELALVEAQQALMIYPVSQDAIVTFARSLARTGRTAEALAAYQQAINLNPDMPVLLVEIARVLASCDDERYRSGSEAVRVALVAQSRYARANPMVLDTLAAAYAEDGQWNEAIEIATAALAMANRLVAAGYPEMRALVRGLESRLALYRLQQPYRVRHGVWDYETTAR